MTRVNVGYDVRKLNTKMLLAEHREIKRIPNAVASNKVVMSGIPTSFTLGKGHVKFFYNKLGYLKKRYVEVYNECIKRGFNVTSYLDAWDNIPLELMGDYKPTILDRVLITRRINSKLKNK